MCKKCLKTELGEKAVTGPGTSAENKADALQPVAQSNNGPSEILPKSGLVYSEKTSLSEVLCKPKIMPLKSITLEKIEQMEKAALRQLHKQPQ